MGNLTLGYVKSPLLPHIIPRGGWWGNTLIGALHTNTRRDRRGNAYSIYFVAITLLFQLLAMFSCFTMYAICQPALDTRKQFVIHRIISLAIIYKPLVSNVNYNMAKTNHIDSKRPAPISTNESTTACILIGIRIRNRL